MVKRINQNISFSAFSRNIIYLEKILNIPDQIYVGQVCMWNFNSQRKDKAYAVNFQVLFNINGETKT